MKEKLDFRHLSNPESQMGENQKVRHKNGGKKNDLCIYICSQKNENNKEIYRTI